MFKINSLFENYWNLKNARVCYSEPGVFALKYLLMAISLALSILLSCLCGRAHWVLTVGIILIRIQLYILLSTYLCFIYNLIIDLYVQWDDATIS